MSDPIFLAFLERQYEETAALLHASDLIAVTPVQPAAFAVELRCKSLIRDKLGEITESDFSRVGIWFPSDYLRRADPFEVVTWLGPGTVFHPNIRAPLICIGRLVPATPLVDILHRVFRIVSWQTATLHDALNPAASAWARANRLRLPIDARPLKRKTLDLEIETIKGANGTP